MHWQQKQKQFCRLMGNIMSLTDKKCGSLMLGLRIFSLYLHRWMVISSQVSSWKNRHLVYRWVRKNIKWESKGLQHDRFFLWIARFLRKIFWEMLVRDI